ncbi:hypothetical protein F2Q69_00047641 [Brassica cretica]|uniref:Uncharacterized protein n=1 Tax=Brassica cretica TaxID=69181 RepID=A0A8S9Q4H2_BRACR|nr:hypothetical protein F2Q69_00047641 [Brassica cretica]
MRASWTDALSVKHRRWLCREEEMVVDIVEVVAMMAVDTRVEVAVVIILRSFQWWWWWWDTIVMVVVSREEEKVEVMRMEDVKQKLW